MKYSKFMLAAIVLLLNCGSVMGQGTIKVEALAWYSYTRVRVTPENFKSHVKYKRNLKLSGYGDSLDYYLSRQVACAQNQKEHVRVQIRTGRRGIRFVSGERFYIARSGRIFWKGMWWQADPDFIRYIGRLFGEDRKFAPQE